MKLRRLTPQKIVNFFIAFGCCFLLIPLHEAAHLWGCLLTGCLNDVVSFNIFGSVEISGYRDWWKDLIISDLPYLVQSWIVFFLHHLLPVRYKNIRDIAGNIVLIFFVISLYPFQSDYQAVVGFEDLTQLIAVLFSFIPFFLNIKLSFRACTKK